MAGETTSGRIPARRGWRETLAVYLDRRMLVILLMGFSSGLPLLLTLSTLSYWLAKVGVDKTAIGLFALVGIPYSFKF
ncbi:MAG: MFS transporter, partial [Dongiaceae bacterium]